jgi:hypothetical protein
MKPEDLKPGDILRAPDGQLWNVDFILPTGGVLVVQRQAVHDLTGWEKPNAHQILSGKEKPSK